MASIIQEDVSHVKTSDNQTQPESTEMSKSMDADRQAEAPEVETSTTITTTTTTAKPRSKKASSLPRPRIQDSKNKHINESAVSFKQKFACAATKNRQEQESLENSTAVSSRPSRGKQRHLSTSTEATLKQEIRGKEYSGSSSSTQSENISTNSSQGSSRACFNPDEVCTKPAESKSATEEMSKETKNNKTENYALPKLHKETHKKLHVSNKYDQDDKNKASTPSQEEVDVTVSQQANNVKLDPKQKSLANMQKACPGSSPSTRGRITESSGGERRPASAITRSTSRVRDVVKEPHCRVRRSLSFYGEDGTPCRGQPSMERAVSVAESVTPIKGGDETCSSIENLRNLNFELRDQVTKLRNQVDAQRGGIKQAQWQKVLDIRQLRQHDHERLTLALTEQKEKLDSEKVRELEHLRNQLATKAESDILKLTRHKDAEITKLKSEVLCKDDMVQRLLGENRHARLKLNIDVRRSKLLDDLKEMRREKKELEDSLSSATFAERTYSDDLRRHTQTFESEIAQVKREAQLEMKLLIEQLKNKDKLISQLEKDLGHQWVAAHLAALERECSEGARGSVVSAPSHSLGALPEDSYDPSLYSWTPTSTPTTGGVEEVKSKMVESHTTGKTDLSKKLKDSKEKNKELVEKCRAYLQRNKELTAQNRIYKDSSEKCLQENKQMQQLLEHSKLHLLQHGRNQSDGQTEKSNLELQVEKVDELRKELMEDRKTINALKQACANKDRRIELMQHRKKKRRLAGSAEKSMGVKETFFGYEEDTKSVDSEHSFSSQSQSTLSDEDVWDEVLSMEETERNYQRLMMEHLNLQRLHAQLQTQCEHNQDPQREAMTKMTLQNDLINAQCRIEKLEKLINEIGEGEVITLLKERETIFANNRDHLEKAQFWEQEGRRVQHELNKALEKCEDLEFQLMEMEQVNDEKQSSGCEDSAEHSPPEYHEQLDRLAEIYHQQHLAVQEMEQLRKELVILLKGKGREADTVLKRLDKITDEEKKRAESLESIARELQMKVISLQKEKDTVYDQINQLGQKHGKGDYSAMAAARERQENMELKTEVAQLSCSESKLLAERIHLYEQLEDWKIQYEYLKQQLDILTKAQSQQKHSPPLKVDACEGISSGSSSPSSCTSQLTRKPSKDRKSKPRSGDDPMETKRRRSSKDVPLSDDIHIGLKGFKILGDMKSDTSHHSFMRSVKSDEKQLMAESVDEIEKMKKAMRASEVQLQKFKDDNFNLQDQLRQCALERSSEAEADQQLLLDKLEVLEVEIGLLRKENGALAQRLKQRMEEYQEELNPRVTELEDYCEDLQERLHASEMTERHVREKLRFVEQSIDDAESSEMAIRERYEELLAKEAEFKKQIQELQRTGRELRDIVLDKDIVEQALRDKVDFLQKAEAASVKRIDELEAIERELREQLELRMDPRDNCQRELNKIQELKHQMTFLETDNKALSARVAELEENEEILRENWRRVADEDFNRTQCLEEKVKMLESFNRDLKSKLTDAQEYFVINTVPPPENSLAAELALSQTRACRRAATFDDDDGSLDGSDSTETSQADVEKKNLKDKLKQLERQLSDAAEEKNTKIESLQEKIVSLKENEIKLSETIAEFEMTERELRAKLALYESSEVTVEKMLKYQSKIEELRTSQESLLDQIESMENQGMTLQEKMQEMERTLRGKIVTLEVEMRGFKQKELKDAARIRELEKQEKELSQKVTQQAEKENGLYVKISSLMDEVKKAKEELNTAKTTMLEKEDKVRKANLLEVKFLEKEMEFGKKISALSTKLRHKEEELRLKEASHEEEVALLQQEVSDKDAEKVQRVAYLEQMFAQKERDLQTSISSLREDMKVVASDRDEYKSNIKELTDRNTDLRDKDIEYNSELDILRQEVTSVKMSEKEYEEKILHLQQSLEKEKQKAIETGNNVISLERELGTEKENVLVIESQIISLKSDIGGKMKNIELGFVEKENEYERQKLSLQEELSMKDERVRELNEELSARLEHMRELEAECEELKSKAAISENETMEKLADLGKILAEKDEQFEELQNLIIEKESEFQELMHLLKSDYELKESEYEKKLSTIMTDKKTFHNEFEKRLLFMNTQLLHEVALKEKYQSSLEQAETRENTLSSEKDGLKKEVEQLRLQLIDKLSELENKNRENCELSLELSNLHHSWKTLQNELDNFKDKSKQDECRFLSSLAEQDQDLEKFRKKLDTAENEVQVLKLELSQRDNIIKEAHVDKDKFLREKQLEIKLLMEEKTHKEVVIQEHMLKSEILIQKSEHEQQNKKVELEKLMKESLDKDVLLEKHTSTKSEMDVQIQGLHSQVETLKGELKHLSQELDIKHSENENYLQKIQKLKEERNANSSKIKLLEKQIVEKHDEIEKRTSEHRGTQSLISSRQFELEQARTELQKCLEEIEEYKNRVQCQESEYHQQSQKCKNMSTDMEKLNVQFREQSEGFTQLESHVAHVELKLVEAENRYRELEAKCASLELQLEENFAQAQYAEKVIRSREEEYQQLESKLTSVEKDFEATSIHVHEAEQIIMIKNQEFKQLESELKKVVNEYGELKASMAEKEDEHRQYIDKFSSLHIEYQQLKSESSALDQEFSRTQTQYESSKSEINALEQKLSALEMSCERAQNDFSVSENRLQEMTIRYENVETKLKESDIQKQNSDMKFAELQSEMKSFESRHSDTDTIKRQHEHLVVELEKTNDEKDQIIQTLQSEIKDIKIQHEEEKSNFEKAGRDLRSMCVQFDDLKDKLDNNEQVLRSSEDNCDTLKGKLKSSEDKLLENSKKISEFTSKISSLENALEEKDSFYRDSKSDLGSLEQKYLEIETEREKLRSQVTYFKKMAEHSQAMCDQNVEKFKEISLVLEQTRTELTLTQNLLSQNDASHTNLFSQLENAQKCLNSSEEEVGSLKKNLKQVDEDHQDLVARNERLILKLEEEETVCKNLMSQLEVQKKQTDDLQLQLLQAVASNKDVFVKLTESEQHYSNTLTELDSVRKRIDSIVLQNKEKCAHLESICQTLQEEINSKNVTIENLKTSEAQISSTITYLYRENASLKAKLGAVEGNVHSDDSRLSELLEVNQTLSSKLNQTEMMFSDTNKKVALLEQSEAKFSLERDGLVSQVKQLEDVKMQLEIENETLLQQLNCATEAFENLRTDLDTSKTKFEINLSEMANNKEESEKALKDIQIELVRKDDFITKLEQEITDLKSSSSEIDHMKSHIFGIEKGSNDLLHQIKEQEGILSEIDIVDESEILVSVSAGLQAEYTSEVGPNDSTELGNNLSHFEDHYRETAERMEILMNEIEMYKRTDTTNQEKLSSLDKLLKEMREKEAKMSERVCELEGRENELLGQIADIEVTVIVPLETENQELKDEINVVKQERDDAQARVSKWGDEDEDQQDVETVHKCLEDALINRDEMEKKVEILCEDVSKLEQEKENLMKKIIDLEASEADHLEAIESLEEEVIRLQGLEKATSVAEETETCLMDRVLDLEEKEQQLLNELAQLNKIMKSCSDQTSGQISFDSLLERLKYLEQKNALLQDAEGRYMDKIVELEEIHHRLQSEMLIMRSSSGDSTYSGSAFTEPALVSADSVLLLMQNTVTHKNTTVSQSSASVSTDTADLWHSTDTADLKCPSEQTSELDMPVYINELEKQIMILTADCTEKVSKLKYLEEKCELLHDSEAKLMEKLLENEENVDSKKDSTHDGDSELKKRLENVLEENEFLAESVENFKQLYKEEKEKTNDLHDRLMENSSVLHDLQDAKAELKTTQQMVEEIQSEYEEQLSEREDLEVHLNNLLVQSQQRETDFQAQLIAAQQREEELQKKLNVLAQDGGITQEFAKLMEDEKHKELQKLEAQLKSNYYQHVQELLKQIQLLQTQQLDEQDEKQEKEISHQSQLEDINNEMQDLHINVHNLDLQKQNITLKQREQDLLSQVDRLEKYLEEMTARVDMSCDVPEEASIHSDSGISADDQRRRYYNSEKSSSEQSFPLESSVTPKIFSSSLTLSLTQPPSSFPNTTQASNEPRSHPPEPVAPPRKGKVRQASIDSVSQEELIFLVEELQNKESALKKRLRELEALADSDLSQRAEQLELENQNLERRLKYAESLNRSFTESPTQVQESTTTVSLPENSGSNITGAVKENLEDTKELNSSISPILSSSTYIMLDKPEDVLHKRIKELENLDKHSKNQLSELEKDREVLHEIARKDKATIHDLNVKIRELQLSERSLKEQVSSLEASENSLYSKCEDLEAVNSKLEDRVHELAIHERRLRELVRKLKLDEEHWLNRSGGMESAVAELAANEQQLKRLLQDAEMVKGGLSERTDYLEARIQELENVEATLSQRLKNYENIEVSLQNKLIHLENSERAAFSKVSELDVMNLDLSHRLQKALEENVVLTQHISQLQGQIHELDRRLLSSQDSELAYKQHMESLQKNESSLQKKVREYELREIDSQARIRELEQITDILNDKLATLQRSENRLKFRVQELEGVVGQGTELTTSQRQNVPQNLEDCQKYIVFLQSKMDSLQLQLREAVKTTQMRLASKTDDGKKVSMPVDEYRQLQTKSALLEETIYQMEEVERANRQLSETILHLRQGKGASGHEVEIEVLKRRLASYKTFVNKLKSSLSMGQATSLWDPELDSGLQGDALPARQLHGLESERVLQSVRGLHDGKADTSNERGAQHLGLTDEKDSIVQSKATLILSSRPASVDLEDDNDSDKLEQASSREESHWKAIEARKPKLVASSRGGATATVGMVAKQAPPTHPNGRKQSSAPDVEEVVLGLHLQSESELSSHYRTNQNDTDSSYSPVPPPRRVRGHRVGKSTNSNNNLNNSGNESSDGALTESDTPANIASTTNKKNYFGNAKSLPSPANKYTSKEQSQTQAPLNRFAEDSFYLPSSTQEGVDSLDDSEAPPLPSAGPPVEEGLVPSARLTVGSVERKDPSDSSASGISIRDRIAMIERQLQTDKLGDKVDDDQLFYSKKKATEGLKQADLLEKDNRSLKDEINRLEKELEEKRRYINILELWLLNLEELLKNKNKQTDRQLMEQLHQELTRLRSELKHVGYCSEDAVLDAAALKTELEHRNREIMSKRNEIDALTDQLKQSQDECKTTEVMRQNILDCLRALEYEIVDLQDKEKSLHLAQAELESLKAQYGNKCEDLNQVISERNELELTLRNAVLERDLIKCDLKKAETESGQLKPVVEGLTKKVEDLSTVEARKSSLEEQLNNLNSLLIARTEKTKEVYEENLILRDHVHQSETELMRLRNLCDDFNNLSARYDELKNYKQQAIGMIEPLQAKLERLARKCQQKDALLGRLGAELRRSTFRPSSALDDLGHLEKVMSQEEYNMDFPQVINGPTLIRPERYSSYSPSSLDELDLNYPYSDTDSTPATSKRKRPTPYVNSRPRSAETLGSGPRPKRGAHAHPRSVLEVGKSRELPQFERLEESQGHFVAIADYDPSLFSQSGRPGLELEMREGELVHVTGLLDKTGCYEAEVNGRIGLVPANYLQPLHNSSHMADHNSDPWLSQRRYGHRPEQMIDMYRDLHQKPSTKVKDSQNVPAGGKNGHSLDVRKPSNIQAVLPDPPSNLHVKRIVNESSILLSWLPPRLDSKGNNNGLKLLGFMVYLDNQEYIQVLSPKICEVVLENLKLEQPYRLAVHSLYAGGHISQRIEVIFEGVVRMAQGQDGVKRAASQEDLDTDLSSVLNSVNYKRGHRRTVVALYDYNPDQQSPLDYTSFELAFQEGQVIHVYGEPRPDGFFHGEIEGRRGLVPACFVEDISERSLRSSRKSH